ncbi:legume-like lectin family-domain-containing protein [Dissophora ornata]|nr:legume-like lectin family-domain-containing protein [Dissophora ornata]
MKTSVLLVPILFLTTALAWGREEPKPPHSDDAVLPFKNRRHDYKQSLKKPFMYNGALPFWSHHGNTFVALDFIRLSPSIPRLYGSVWRSGANEYKEWEVEYSFRAHGQSYVGGKGLAFWYTQDRAIEGPVFGSKDQWQGLGIFMDTSDPANQRVNPIMYGILNDGTKTFPSNPTKNSASFGGCVRDYKNSPVPVVVRVSYIGQTLKVAVDTLHKGAKMVACFEQKDISLPAGYYFGFSSAETGTPDDHDLLSFEVYEVNPPPKTEKNLRPHEAEMIRKGEEVKVDEGDKQAQVAATVADTQFRIIESLNTIHNKLESLGAPMQPPESTAESLSDINQKINSMASSLQAMESVVQGLVDHIMKQGGMRDTPDITKVLKEELRHLNNKMEDMDVSFYMSACH